MGRKKTWSGISVAKMKLNRSPSLVTKTTMYTKTHGPGGWLRAIATVIGLLVAALLVIHFWPQPKQAGCAICGESVFWSTEEYVEDKGKYFHVKCLDR